MTSANAAKGKKWERESTAYLRAVLSGAYRPHAEGFKDVGDTHTSLFALQMKDEARHDFSGYLRDAEKQRGHAGQTYAAAVVKRRRHGTADAYVVMDLRTFRALHDRLDDAEDALRRADHYAYDSHIDSHKEPAS